MFRYWYAHLLVLFSFSIGAASYLDHQNAVIVIVPVTDSFRIPLQTVDSRNSIDDSYKNLPFSPETGPHSCPRARQFIFNEVGRLLSTTADGSEVYVEFPHLYHQDEKGQKQNQFWLPAKSVQLITTIRQKIGSLWCIPEPIQSTKPDDPARFENILTLIMPWKDPDGVTYSAGTRFKRARHLDTVAGYGIYLLSAELEMKTALVDKAIALVDYPKDDKSAKKLFVKILKKWASLSPTVLAYVWGGCSFIETYPAYQFSLVAAQRGDDNLTYWVRPEAFIPYGGFDCSGLVLRAAQIVGLPYFFSNTTTLSLNLQDLAHDEQLEEGDLIFYKGHVMVVTDLKNNKLVQAASYSSGYGIVHEIPLNELFEHCNSYEELCQCYGNKAPLKIKNKEGLVTRVIEAFRLLKMAHTPSGTATS